MNRETSTLEEKIPTLKETGPIDLKKKLIDLEQLMPGQEKIIYDFADFLSKIASEKGMQKNFDMLVEFALSYIKSGENKSTGEQIPESLKGQQDALRKVVPQIKQVIFPEPEEE